jgi:Holliday junction resolvasome RuvABC endonuclease subunit
MWAESRAANSRPFLSKKWRFKMICIGLDLATIKTGCSVKKNKDLLYYTDICITSKEEPDFRKRIKYIGSEIEKIIKKYSPDKIFIEFHLSFFIHHSVERLLE